jgi:hypothetical protein
MLKHFPLAKNFKKKKKTLFQHLTMGKYIFSTLIIPTFCKWEKINHVVCVINPGIKIDLLLLLLPSMGQNPLSYYNL